jgi:hypothetical protein
VNTARDAGEVDADAGLVAQSAPPPPSVSFETERGTLTSPEAFSIESAQTELQDPVDGGFGYLGFQLSDVAQCTPADLDGGSTSTDSSTSHVLNGFVRRFDGAPAGPGLYAIGMSDDGSYQAYVEETEFDRDGGSSRTLLATSGHVSVSSYSAGHLEGGFDVQLGDPAQQQELPLTGQFNSDSCNPP